MEEGICYLTLNRPQRLNAMDPSLLEGLLEGLQGAAAEGARVVAIEGVGRAFSAGADLVEFYRA
ncbi:MAG: enoyl-CoA hydratase/isomerase family protein, partial [Deltaproteobacteria bacterium]